MKTKSLFAALVPALLLTACAGEQSREAEEFSTSNYRCESGARIAAYYPNTDTAVIKYQGKSIALSNAVSASGARYVGAGLEWWTKGSGSGSSGMLLEHNTDGTSGEVLELCIAE